MLSGLKGTHLRQNHQINLGCTQMTKSLHFHEQVLFEASRHYYGLDLKFPLKVHVLKPWYPVLVLLGQWDLQEVWPSLSKQVIGGTAEGDIGVLVFCFFLLFGHHEVSSFVLLGAPPPWCFASPQTQKQQGQVTMTETYETMSQTEIFPVLL